MSEQAYPMQTLEVEIVHVACNTHVILKTHIYYMALDAQIDGKACNLATTDLTGFLLLSDLAQKGEQSTLES